LAPRSLLTAHARAIEPFAQVRRDAAILEAAAYGECHLHVSTLAGEVLALGAFHRPLAPCGGAVWRRTTGGRALSCGDGFVVVTLGLPHRSYLVADDRWTLRPEQVMNRCVRGLLAWLRARGVDALYPGLDMLTWQRRALVHLSFAESEQGPTLFQAVVATTRTFADTARLADRLDPEGRVPITLIADAACARLADAGPSTGGRSTAALDLAALAAAIGDAYAGTFALEAAELDPEVAERMTADPHPPADATAAPDPADPAPTAIATGLLGQVGAAAEVVAGRVASFSLTGDFVAPARAIARLRERVVGGPATPDAVTAAVDSVLDGQRGYLLGLSPAALRDLVVRAVAA